MAKTPLVWSASMISPDQDFDGAPRLRTEVVLATGHGEVVQAVLHATARGVFEAFLNGAPVSDDVLSPGWSAYEWRLRYRSYEVTSLIRSRPVVVLGLALGNGWFRGRLGWTGHRSFYGSELGAFAQLEVTFADGFTQTVATDESWTAGPSEVLANDLYDGQTVDARRASDAWLQPGFSDQQVGVHTADFDESTLTPYLGPPVRRIETVRPVAVWQSPAGKTLVDFGQNLVGWLAFTVRGRAGDEITVRHAEVLEHDELGTRPLRTALATDRFILSGGHDRFEPTLTFHGFRYVEVTGWPGELTAESLTAVVVHSDLERIGHFSCSDDLLNQLHRNVVWGQRGNFLDVPTDCPQRDERLGWTGDLAAFAPTAVFNFRVDGFLRDWLADLAVEQAAADGRVPAVIPDMLKFERNPSEDAQESAALWSDAAVWVPWAAWQAYGDEEALAAAYPAMVAHLRHVETLLSDTGLWDTGFQYGDWLDPTAPPEDAFRAQADPGVVATACFYRSAQWVSEAARVLGRPEEAETFADLADSTRLSFTKHYVSADGVVTSDCQTVYALAIVFGLLEDELRQQAGDRLAELVVANHHRISTGFAGTPFVTDALTGTGHLDVAYRLLLERECPSWLYPVTMGATTVWERWDSMLPDGTINPGQMTSFNHYALGAVADWMHRVIGGISPAQPGYRSVTIAPRPGGGLTWAKTSLRTPQGEIAVSWRHEDGSFALDVTTPDEVTGTIVLPDGRTHTVAAGTHHFTADVPPTSIDPATPQG